MTLKSYYLISKNGETPIKDKSNEELAGNTYYFKDGTNLLDIKNKDLIPYDKDFEVPPLKDVKPYYWE